VHRFDHRPGEQGGEVAVHMVRNGWVHPLLCTSHPTKNRALSPSYLFRDEALRNLRIFVNMFQLLITSKNVNNIMIIAR